MLKKVLTSPWTALITLALVLSVRVADPAFVESVRLRYFDTLITSKPAEPSGVSVVNIDEASLEKYGQFPFSRDVYAGIIRDLYSRNAGLVVFNVLTPDRDRMGRDGDYVATLQNFPTVLPSVGSTQTRNQPRTPGSAVIGPVDAGAFVSYPGIIANIPPVERAAVGVGITNTLPEIDGVVRRMPMVVEHNGRLYPSLAMEVMRVAAGDSTFQVRVNELGVEKMRIPQFGPIATDSLSRIWIDWSLQSQNYSLTKLPQDFVGQIVIVGVSAQGLNNPVATARGEVLPQDLQATVIGTVIANASRPAIARPDWTDGAEILALALTGILLLFLTRYVYVGLASTVALVAVGVIGSWFAYNSFLFLFDATAFAVGTGLVALHAYGAKFVTEFLQKQQIKKQFGTYLSPAMVEKLARNPELLQLGGESRELSIMFTDVRGFTSISEHYGDNVQGLTQIMNRYMTAMTARIIENQGTLDKYIGDAQMAFWNAPMDDPEHARHAVDTALQMLGDLDAFNQSISSEGVPPFGMGLGINTGTVVVGNMGSDQRFDYTCLGDSVNLASRLEGQSKPYGVKIVLGPKTAEYVKQDYLVLELDCIAVKGKTQGVNIYTVLGRKDQMNVERGDEQMHSAMLELYRQQRFDQAVKFCQELKGRFGGEMDHYYDAWIERCEEMKDVELPRDWDGVFRATSK